MTISAQKTFYKIGTLARESGISETLLRAWEKRYQLWFPERGPGGHRLYSQEDLLLIRHIADATRSGMRIGELAALGRRQLLQNIKGSKETAGSLETVFEEELSDTTLECYISPLVSAAESVNPGELRNGLKRALLELSRDKAVYGVFIPAMVKVGELYLAGRINVAGEHLISNIIEYYLHNCIDQARQAASIKTTNSVLCGCFPGDEHKIGLLSVAYGLTRSGCDVTFLGSALPLDALELTIKQLQPTSVWLSVTNTKIYKKYRSEFAELARNCPCQFVLGGQAVRPDDRLLLKAGCKLWTAAVSQPEAIHSFIMGEINSPLKHGI